MISKKLSWIVWFELWLHLSSSAQDLPKKLIAAVGESVTFPLEIPPSFREILWNKNKVNIVTVEPGSPCQLLTFGDYRRRQVNVSKDCGSLTVTELHKEDSAEYTAQILVPGQQSPVLTFHLQVYKRLSEKDLDAACAKVVPGSGNETWQLNCSAGTWEEGVEFSWTSAIQSSSGRLLVIQRNLQEKDLNATCTAKNPIGNTSRTFSLRNTCVGKDKSLDGIIAGIVIVILACIGGGVVWWWQKKRRASPTKSMSLTNSEPEEASRRVTVKPQPYSESNRDTEKPQQRRAPKTKREELQTVYATVDHIGQNPKQEKNEEKKKEKKKAAETTIYSEIRPQEAHETEDQNCRTIYEKVKAVRPTEPSEYDKIL
ncbi:SLAM family member 5-like isoform X2 [Hemicordylus capensis]|uniref:SLAM family member 5-like isoform X2 n=1 Tax=Hemicordylus capensis TaxID=884348 RepID=UPI0023039E58|nr:SLAM family member 5-like isoform X2 [Hemicordylus capensis]